MGVARVLEYVPARTLSARSISLARATSLWVRATCERSGATMKQINCYSSELTSVRFVIVVVSARAFALPRARLFMAANNQDCAVVSVTTRCERGWRARASALGLQINASTQSSALALIGNSNRARTCSMSALNIRASVGQSSPEKNRSLTHSLITRSHCNTTNTSLPACWPAGKSSQIEMSDRNIARCGWRWTLPVAMATRALAHASRMDESIRAGERARVPHFVHHSR